MTIPDELLAELQATADVKRLVVGIGSCHAADMIGWTIAEEIADLRLPQVTVRRALVPLDVLDWIEDYAQVHLVDAMHGGPALVQRWQWPNCDQLLRNSSSTHGFDVVSMLQLASALGKIHAQVTIWGIPSSLSVH